MTQGSDTACQTVTVEHDGRIQYAIEVLVGAALGEPLQPHGWLHYGRIGTNAKRRRIHIVASGFFGDLYAMPGSLPRLPITSVDGVPLVYGAPCVEKRKDTLVIHADVVASTYFLTTRYEEWVRRDVRDEHGRFPGKESLPYRAGFIHRPVVDEYARLLRKWAAQVGIHLPEPKRRFSVLLTHDVDSLGVSRGPVQVGRCLARGCVGRTSVRQAFADAAVAGGFRRHSFDNLEDVVRLDKRLTEHFRADQCRSLFFFMAGGNTPHDGPYRLRSRHVLNLVQYVRKSGAEIGLHASYEAGTSPDRVRVEREALETATGLSIDKNRHHFLRWREPEHGAAIADAGIRWDTTLGYADVAGFRLGVCRPIPLFDPLRQCPMGIEEHPLIVMDCTLERERYMNLGEEAAFGYVRQLADATAEHRGEFVALWHNTVLAPDAAGYHRRLYPRVLDYLGTLLTNHSAASM